MKQISVINNFLPKKDFSNILKIIMSDQFPWYFVSQSTWEKTKHQKDCFFCHSIKYENNINSDIIDEVMKPIQNKLGYKKLLRAKLNLHIDRGYPIPTNYHCDFPKYISQNKKFTTAILYLNTCNGYTEFEDNGYKCYSEENKLVIFPGDLRHRGVSQTDKNRRVCLNINFI